MELIKTLVKERKMRYISQTAMAEHLNITLATLYRYEQGKRKIPFDLACKYADKLGFEFKLLVKT